MIHDTENKFSVYLFVSLRYGSAWCFQRISGMSSLPARMNASQSKMKELEWSQHFPHYKSFGIFPDTQEQLTP